MSDAPDDVTAPPPAAAVVGELTVTADLTVTPAPDDDVKDGADG